MKSSRPIFLIVLIAVALTPGCVPNISAPWPIAVSGADDAVVSPRPVSIAVIVNDSRRSSWQSWKWTSWLPLVPYSGDQRPGVPLPAFTSADYADIIPLLVAKDIRKSKMALHSVMIDGSDDQWKSNYEVALRLKVNDCHLLERRYTYCLSIAGAALWILGAPHTSASMNIDVAWTMETTKDGAVVGNGVVRQKTTIYDAFYYRLSKETKEYRDQSLSAEIHLVSLQRFSAELLHQLDQAFVSKGDAFWQSASFRRLND